MGAIACHTRPSTGFLRAARTRHTATGATAAFNEKGEMKTCTPTCTSDRHTPTCRQRARRARAKRTEREQPDQNRRAYLTDELGLPEADRVGVEDVARTEIRDESGTVIGWLGPAKREDLLRCIERHGKIAGVIESASALPLWEYRVVEEEWRKAPVP
jgi:hypothetical protein